MSSKDAVCAARDIILQVRYDLQDFPRNGEHLDHMRAELREVDQTLAVASDAIDFIRDTDCNCRPATEQYEANICRRCDLLTRLGVAL